MLLVRGQLSKKMELSVVLLLGKYLKISQRYHLGKLQEKFCSPTRLAREYPTNSFTSSPTRAREFN